MAGPADCTPAELLMNRTMATKMTTRSNGPSVLATRTGAICSETMARFCSCAAANPLTPFSSGSGPLADQGDAPEIPLRSRRILPPASGDVQREARARLALDPVQAARVLGEDRPPQALRLRG